MSNTPDLYALVIRLRPERDSSPPDPRGHGAQALFLDLLRQVAPDLAAQLHADALSKPYTVAVLPQQEAGYRGQGPGDRGQGAGSVELRVAFTRAELFPI